MPPYSVNTVFATESGGKGGGALGLRQRGPARRRAARPCLERLSAASSRPKSSKASAVAEGKEGGVESRAVL